MLGAIVAALSLVPATAHAAKPTGRYLVSFESNRTARSASALSSVLSRAGARRAGKGVPRVGIATVRGPRSAISALRRDPRVESVSPEYIRDLRAVPSDPAVRLSESGYSGVPPGTPIQWALARQQFPAAWDITRGTNAIVGVLDTGIDGGHPELARKIYSGTEWGTSDGAFSDEEGHGTHVAGLACAATDNGAGVAGAGWDCKVAVEKIALLRDQDVIDGIIDAASKGVHSINMSFGGGPESGALERAFEFAIRRKVVLVASASNEAETDQGAPAAQLQKNAADITAGRGLVVTAADFSNARAGTGRGDQISVAAYGFFDEFEGPPGLISTFPGRRTFIDGVLGCGCRRTLSGSRAYAYLQGTSMAAPQVAALAALVGQLNPALTVKQKLRIIKLTARGGASWNPDLGWGIIDAGRALDQTRRVDATPPRTRIRAVVNNRLRRKRNGRSTRTARVRLRLLGRDRPGHPRLVASGVRHYDLYAARVRKGEPLRFKRIRKGLRREVQHIRLRRGRYRLYIRALDEAGNREPQPRSWDARTIVRGAKRRR